MGLFGDDGSDAAKEANQRNRDLYNKLLPPKFQQYTPEQLKNVSANYQTINQDPLIKSAQESALAKMSGLADNGLTAADQANFQQARNIGSQQAASGNAAALQNAAARGVGGSGLEFAMREMANQGASQNAQNAGLQQASDSARQKAMYQQAYGQQLSGYANQQNNLAAQNTGIVNQFNAMNTNNQNDANRENTRNNNQAYQYNQGNQQRDYQNQLQKAGGIAGTNNEDARIAADRAAAQQGQVKAIGGLIGAGAGAYLGAGTKTGAAAGAGMGAGFGQLLGGL